MNESETVIIDQNADVAEESDTPTPKVAEAVVSDVAATDPATDADATKEADEGFAEETGISNDSRADPDPDSDTAPGTNEENGLDKLRGELKRLREELAQRDAMQSRAEREYEEFSKLYPEVPLSALSDGVWKSVEEGLPLAAAYALAERRQALLRIQAEESNRENLLRSAGRHTPTPAGYFSPEEVRNMSQKEVRTHYSAILESMKLWK